MVVGPRLVTEKFRKLRTNLNRLSCQWQILLSGARVAGNTEALARFLFNTIRHRVNVLRRHVGIDGIFVLTGLCLLEKVIGNAFQLVLGKLQRGSGIIRIDEIVCLNARELFAQRLDFLLFLIWKCESRPPITTDRKFYQSGVLALEVRIGVEISLDRTIDVLSVIDSD